MTIEELELQVKKNTAAIASVSDSLSSYTTNAELNTTNLAVSASNADIKTLLSLVSQINSSIALVNKLSKLLDVNIEDVQKDDILQWDGNRWTNNSPKYIFGSLVTKVSLESLSDVKINNKANKQALCWDNSVNKWVNTTIETGGGGGDGMNIDAMWKELKTYNPSKLIDKSHIADFVLKNDGQATNLTVNNLTGTGLISLSNGDTALNVLSSGLSANGNFLTTGEVTAFT